ncbi:5'-nucleotidase C-terminal domain-containing protein [bacterium]|nr:5'-nucleotidase C-terminal domain-containing protein [bacterium]
MKIDNLNNKAFQGKFYLTTDIHGRCPMAAGVLTEIGSKCKNTKEQHFYLDGGDAFSDTMPYKVLCEIYKTFKGKNPSVPMLINMGNVEIERIIRKTEGFVDALKDLANNGIDLVSVTLNNFLKSQNMDNNYVKPYKIIEDRHESGKTDKILVTGLNVFNINNLNGNNITIKSDVNDMKLLLKDVIKPVFDKEKPNKTILMLHVFPQDVQAILDYAKSIGIDNVGFVLGGHPHFIDDYLYNDTRVLYPPAQGKGALVVDNTQDEIKFSKFIPYKNKYKFEPLLNNDSVIANIDIHKPLAIDADYKKHIDEFGDIYNKPIATATVGLKFRNEYESTLSEPTELGTFVANAYRDFTGSDIGFLLSMDLREKVPMAGQIVTGYHISDTMNVEKDIYKYEGLTADEIKGMLEVSLKSQENGITNGDFIEYSDNIKVARFVNPKNSENKVAQIYIKENGEFVPLLDENQKQISDKKYTIATCDYVAKGPARASLDYFKQFPAKKVQGLTTRTIIEKQYEKFEKEGINTFKPSEIINIEF